jgi:hypothetical protein
MDTKELLTEIKARFNHNLAKDYLRDKQESRLIFADQGGLWKVTLELLTFLRTSTDDTVVLLDTYNNPLFLNRKQILEKAENVYLSVMTDWANEWKELERKR